MLREWPGLQAVQYDMPYYSQHISWPEWFESVDSFKSPFVWVHFDTGNIMPFQFPEHWIPLLGSFLGQPGRRQTHEPLGWQAGQQPANVILGGAGRLPG